MPRIAFIPPPMAFNDRSTELVAPIMSNAMQLADTFATEIPRIRMQQDAMAEEKQRYGAEQSLRMQERDYRRERDTLGDQRYEAEQKRQGADALRKRFKDTDGLLAPDAIDTDGDGVADFGAGMTGARSGSALPRAAAGFGAQGALALRERGLDDRESQFNRKERNDFVRSLMSRNVGTDISPKYLTVEEAMQAWGKLNPSEPSGVLPSSGTYSQDPFGEMDPPVEDGTEASTGMRMNPVYTDARKMMALQALDSERALPETERVAAGGRSDMQIEQLKMLIMGDQYPGAGEQPAAAPAAEAPAPEPEAPPLSMGAEGGSPIADMRGLGVLRPGAGVGLEDDAALALLDQLTARERATGHAGNAGAIRQELGLPNPIPPAAGPQVGLPAPDAPHPAEALTPEVLLRMEDERLGITPDIYNRSVFGETAADKTPFSGATGPIDLRDIRLAQRRKQRRRDYFAQHPELPRTPSR